MKITTIHLIWDGILPFFNIIVIVFLCPGQIITIWNIFFSMTLIDELVWWLNHLIWDGEVEQLLIEIAWGSNLLEANFKRSMMLPKKKKKKALWLVWMVMSSVLKSWRISYPFCLSYFYLELIMVPVPLHSNLTCYVREVIYQRWAHKMCLSDEKFVFCITQLLILLTIFSPFGSFV